MNSTQGLVGASNGSEFKQKKYFNVIECENGYSLTFSAKNFIAATKEELLKIISENL